LRRQRETHGAPINVLCLCLFVMSKTWKRERERERHTHTHTHTQIINKLIIIIIMWKQMPGFPPLLCIIYTPNLFSHLYNCLHTHTHSLFLFVSVCVCVSNKDLKCPIGSLSWVLLKDYVWEFVTYFIIRNTLSFFFLHKALPHLTLPHHTSQEILKT